MHGLSSFAHFKDDNARRLAKLLHIQISKNGVNKWKGKIMKILMG
jgi:DNA-binding transcriptional regulator WhiA